MKTSPKRYKNIDLHRVEQVLRVRAYHLYRADEKSEKMMDATTADDLVHAVLCEYLTHPTGMNWDPKQGRLECFLRKVLDRRWIDRCRRESKMAASFDDSKNPLEPQARPKDPLVELEQESFLKRMRDQVKDYPDFLELIEAVEILDDDCSNVNQELAELIGTSVKDIENRKKRLRRLLTGFRNEK